MPSGQLPLSAFVAFLIAAFCLPQLAAGQVQVPTPVPRPQKAPAPKGALPVPDVANTAPATKPVTKAAPADIPGKAAYPVGRVVVLRGLANVFSRGMDAIAKDLKGRGVDVTLQNHSRWQSISAELIAEYRANPAGTGPVIIVGHSLGGDAAIVMANWLVQNRVPVRLVVVFDAVAKVQHPISGGVAEVINFYKPKGYGQQVRPSASFTGKLDNVDLTDRTDIDHLNIDKDPVLQQEVIGSVMRIIAEANGAKPAARRAAPAGPTVPQAPAPVAAATAD